MKIKYWTAREVADYLRVSPRHLTERVSVTPTFPVPVRLPTITGGNGRPIWDSAEIIDWAEAQRVS